MTHPTLSPRRRGRVPPKELSPAAQARFKALVTEYRIATRRPAGAELRARQSGPGRSRGSSYPADGQTTTDRWGQTKPHPLLAAARDHRAAWLAALRQLNLSIGTPTAPAGRRARNGTQSTTVSAPGGDTRPVARSARLPASVGSLYRRLTSCIPAAFPTIRCAIDLTGCRSRPFGCCGAHTRPPCVVRRGAAACRCQTRPTSDPTRWLLGLYKMGRGLTAARARPSRPAPSPTRRRPHGLWSCATRSWARGRLAPTPSNEWLDSSASRCCARLLECVDLQCARGSRLSDGSGRGRPGSAGGPSWRADRDGPAAR